MITEVVLPPRKPRTPIKRVKRLSSTTTKPKARVKGKQKAKSISKLKKELDTIFSLYIRAKYSKQCFTCSYTGSALQNGHWIPRQYLATRWEEDNCRPQCRNCNVFRHGLPFEFEERLVKELGLERVNEMKYSRRNHLKLNREFYTTNIWLYQEKVKQLG